MSVCLLVCLLALTAKCVLVCVCVCVLSHLCVCVCLYPFRLIQDLTQPMTALVRSQTPWPITGEFAGASGACSTA